MQVYLFIIRDKRNQYFYVPDKQVNRKRPNLLVGQHQNVPLEEAVQVFEGLPSLNCISLMQAALLPFNVTDQKFTAIPIQRKRLLRRGTSSVTLLPLLATCPAVVCQIPWLRELVEHPEIIQMDSLLEELSFSHIATKRVA